jgi:hypothetical protein
MKGKIMKKLAGIMKNLRKMCPKVWKQKTCSIMDVRKSPTFNIISVFV